MMDFGRHLLRSACSFSVVTLALSLPLAACGSMHGSSSDASPAAASAGAASATASGTATGSVDRSGAASTTDTADTSKSTVGGVVTTAMAGAMTAATATAASATAASVVTKPQPVSGPVTGPTPTPISAPNPAPSNKKSISAWVSCGTAADDTTGAQKAFAAARQNAFTLLVDCPVHLKSGLAIDRGIFIDNGTSVEFTGAGKFYVDNLFHPAFVIANSSNITLTNWNVEWDGTVPINPDVGGYIYEGSFVTNVGRTQPAGAFNDLVLTAWLTANRKVTFDETQGWVEVDLGWRRQPDGAVFYLTGDTSHMWSSRA